MRETCAIDPGFVVKTDCVDDEGISLVPTNRVPHPRQIRILGMLAPIGEDLAYMVIELEQFNHPARGLNDLKYEGLNIDPWHAGRKTPDIFPRGRIHVVSRIVDCPGSVGRLRGQVSLLSPRRHRRNFWRKGIAGPWNVAHVAFPNSRQVHCGGSSPGLCRARLLSRLSA